MHKSGLLPFRENIHIFYIHVVYLTGLFQFIFMYEVKNRYIEQIIKDVNIYEIQSNRFLWNYKCIPKYFLHEEVLSQTYKRINISSLFLVSNINYSPNSPCFFKYIRTMSNLNMLEVYLERTFSYYIIWECYCPIFYV